MKLFKKVKINALTTAIAFVVLGLVLILLPGITEWTICYIIAAALFLLGALYIIDYFRVWDIAYRSNGLAIGMLGVLGALFFLLRMDVVARLVPLLLGAAVIVSGVLKLQNAIVLFKIKDKGWAVTLLALSALCLVFGFLVMEDPFASPVARVVVMGSGLLFSGLTDLVIIFVMPRRLQGKAEA